MRYIQSRGLATNPANPFDQDLTKQIKEWRGKGERILIMMDINNHPLRNNFYTKLHTHNTDLDKFTHKCWGPNEPYTHHSGKSQIDGRYKSPEVEVVNLAMLTFAEITGDHRSFVLNLSMRSLLGVYRYKVCRPVSCRLKTS